ncbi:hypothetical protein DPMN_165721 [Dreissena polymorpha]|uniref:Uncharacterized protein n=1 Tax=Dreissena polymorpha TaxID=45954 RepID=A0A9D4IUV4_DREPO|nr:hypothetical protein DPMN_165721 [Dreissena polymorpha]
MKSLSRSLKGIYSVVIAAKLEAHLLESERLLGEISSITRQDVPNIVSMGTALSTMEQSVETMKNELKKYGILSAFC